MISLASYVMLSVQTSPLTDMNAVERDTLIQSYIDRVIDNMSTKDLIRVVWEQLEENLSLYSDEELKSEIEDYYPELLEE